MSEPKKNKTLVHSISHLQQIARQAVSAVKYLVRLKISHLKMDFFAPNILARLAVSIVKHMVVLKMGIPGIFHTYNKWLARRVLKSIFSD